MFEHNINFLFNIHFLYVNIKHLSWILLTACSTGYSIAVAQNVLSKDKDTIVTGAPRDEARGSVTMAEVHTSGINREVQIKATVMGEQIGSYFGCSVAIVDLNNDG